ncbi:uncharacterized protein LOC143174989 [Nomia melanderi]|uniref:uncharacterized protein LOC143174989 n=1 Tax=Nomia melanderi TaxID=2448451 RepID=UPI003FCDF65E
MKLDGIQTLSETRKDAIVRFCVISNMKLSGKIVSALMDETSLDYQRTMCDVMWRRMIEQNPELFKFITWTPNAEQPRPPRKGKIDTGMENFPVIKARWIPVAQCA